MTSRPFTANEVEDAWSRSGALNSVGQAIGAPNCLLLMMALYPAVKAYRSKRAGIASCAWTIGGGSPRCSFSAS